MGLSDNPAGFLSGSNLLQVGDAPNALKLLCRATQTDSKKTPFVLYHLAFHGQTAIAIVNL